MSEKDKWCYPRAGIHGMVVHEIGREIVTGVLKPGNPIPHESEIIKRFNGSRTAIREAFRVLTAKGLIEAKQRAGTYVRDREYWNLLDPDILAWQSLDSAGRNDFRNMAETRELMEPLVVRLVAQRATDEELDRLEDTYLAMKEAVESNSLMDLHAGCVDFHMTLFEICHNDLILRLSGVIQSMCDYQLQLRSAENSIPDGILGAYHAILIELRNRNVDGAEQAMSMLIEALMSDMRQLHNEQLNQSREVA
ncbi:MAG: FadR family transcriptional regulator [Proteobacteria bacterium]|nr:FadR family transcriptional regulator [Pseudomonadota bacterium]